MAVWVKVASNRRVRKIASQFCIGLGRRLGVSDTVWPVVGFVSVWVGQNSHKAVEGVKL